jgi:hypothetical protein
MDPYWFSYLSLQIARSAELFNKSNRSKRYFIYPESIIHEYRRELKSLVEAHNGYVIPYLYYAENVESELENDHNLLGAAQKLLVLLCSSRKKAAKAHDLKREWTRHLTTWELERRDRPLIVQMMDFIYIRHGNEVMCWWRNPMKDGEPKRITDSECLIICGTLLDFLSKLENRLDKKGVLEL